MDPTRYRTCPSLFLLVTLLWASATPAGAQTWRSSLYPEGWKPGHANEHGLFVHDFSYAGYHMGEVPVPDQVPGEVVDVTRAPFHADPSGNAESTRAIQQALDVAGRAGGGVVYLPEGTYRVRPPEGSNAALTIAHSGVVLRGAGPGRTFLFNDAPHMRQSRVIAVHPEEGRVQWERPEGAFAVRLAADAPNQTRILRLESTQGLAEGDWVVLRVDLTDAFIEEHAPKYQHLWPGYLKGPTFYRQITRTNRQTDTIEIDIPIRLALKKRDNARIYRVAPHLEEVGIEHLSIGMQEHPSSEGWGDSDYNKQGTAAWDVHGAYMIHINHLVNGWVRNVHSYRPRSNRQPHHLASNGISVSHSRNVTVMDCDLRHAQYRGGGGNGYGYLLRGSDNLYVDCRGEELRYVFDFGSMQTTGNVILRGEAHSRSDFHMHLSVGNLIDNLRVVNSDIYAGSRYDWGGEGWYHGRSTKDSVIWNVAGHGNKPDHLIDITAQADAVVIIGTRGTRTAVKGREPAEDHRIEGVGRGGSLEPQSLYEDQRKRRLNR